MEVFVLTLNDLNEIIKEESMEMEEAMKYYHNKKDDDGNTYFIATETQRKKFKRKKKILATFDVDSQSPSVQEL